VREHTTFLRLRKLRVVGRRLAEGDVADDRAKAHRFVHRERHLARLQDDRVVSPRPARVDRCPGHRSSNASPTSIGEGADGVDAARLAAADGQRGSDRAGIQPTDEEANVAVGGERRWIHLARQLRSKPAFDRDVVKRAEILCVD